MLFPVLVHIFKGGEDEHNSNQKIDIILCSFFHLVLWNECFPPQRVCHESVDSWQSPGVFYLRWGESPFGAIRHSKHSGRFTQSVNNAEGYRGPATSYRSFIKGKFVWCWFTRLYSQLPPLVKTIMPIHLLKFQKHTICAWFSNNFI